MNKQLVTLMTLLVVGIGVCVWIIQKPSQSEFEPIGLFEDLNSVASQIDSVTIENSSGTLFKGKKHGEQWLAEVGHTGKTYPIEKSKVANLINSLLQGKLIEAKTSRKANLERLGLKAIDQEDSLARLITITVGNKAWQVLVGNQASVGEGSYVRFVKQPQSWRLDRRIELPVGHFSWLQHPILPFEVKDILTVTRVGNDNWSMTKYTDEIDFAMENMPEDRLLAYDGVLTGFVENLVALDYEELISIDDNVVNSLNLVTKLNVVTQQYQEFTVILSQANGAYYVNFNINGAEQYWQNWYYQISGFTAQQLNKVTEDFLQKIDEEEKSTFKPISNEESS
ncbi:DUF4340 domain-containing protein [Paraglaciecola aquimarina]|uniref:DUF4340 domain-containing protein n=1 Tax=Paraglaciecola aquimarina TaxID=1235557 RepID=A0ABU3SWM1_9ALTE|nr:DUF4340 domain-containing protein [Paraglaciecola aquimarina]MDU0354395.1 DUF4340 domain-containing protein [Paraglaciecola aquimarina]